MYGTPASDLDDDDRQPLDPTAGEPSGAEVPDADLPDHPISAPADPVYAPVAEVSDVDDALAFPDDDIHVD